MRFSLRHTLVATAACAGLLLVAGCSSSTAASDKVLDRITVSDAAADAGAEPTVTINKQPLKAATTQSKVLTEGDGEALAADDIASVDALLVNATDGSVIDSTWGKVPVGIDLSQASLFPALKTELPGKKVGSRVLIAAPQSDVFGEEGDASVGLKGTDSVIFVLDIKNAVKPLKEATGTAAEINPALPTVEWKGPKEPAVVTMPADTAPPAELVIQPLITGDGAEVTAGQTLRVNYTGVLWKDGTVFDSSATSPQGSFQFTVGEGRVISGWDKGLVGQKVGSRLMLVVPPAEGYGANGSPPAIAGDDTLVFVVDILAAY